MESKSKGERWKGDIEKKEMVKAMERGGRKR
jgi:hypothetical protein